MDANYLTQRLAAIGGNSDIEVLRAENARLKEQLGQAPQAEFKNDAQKAFEQSREFEQLLNLHYMRWIRDKFGTEFRGSPYAREFQTVANQVYIEFEKGFKKTKKTQEQAE